MLRLIFLIKLENCPIMILILSFYQQRLNLEFNKNVLKIIDISVQVLHFICCVCIFINKSIIE